jgi:alpha-beta hydrolase superfamily lysophospholipase
MILEEKLELLSSDGIHLLKGVALVPKGKIKGYFHVVHGMCEYMVRYREFLHRMAEEGYLAFGFDQLGHGKSAGEKENLGFVAEKRGWEHLVDDAVLVSEFMKSRYGTMPYFLFGHSMGSFISRLAAARILPSALVLCGTADQNPMAGAGEFLCKLVCRIRGPRYISDFLQALVFASYDERFPGDYKGRWLTVDTENLLRYKDDPFCTFRFTASAMGDLIALHRRSNMRRNLAKIPKEAPILLVSGKEDPVGGYGKGIDRFYRRLLRQNFKAEMHLYEGYRHEILYDFCQDEVVRDILNSLQEKKTP